MSTSIPQSTDRSNQKATGRSTRRLLVPVVAAFGLALTACSGGPGTEAEFVEVLSRNGNLTDAEASCIADAVFDEYGADEDALGKISAAPDIEFLDGEDGVPGFTDFYRATVGSCAQAGPSQG